MKKLICLLLALLTVLSGCSGLTAPTGKASEKETETEKGSQDVPKPTVPKVKPELPGEKEQWAEKLDCIEPEHVGWVLDPTEFDAKLMTYLSKNVEGNYMASPLSFRYALGLLLAGAEGETRTELLKALGVSSEAEWRDSCRIFNGFTAWFARDLERETENFRNQVAKGWIDKDSPEPFRALRVANSVWKREDIQEDFEPLYRELAEAGYGAEYRSFTPANAVEQINRWADIKTEGLIPELLPETYDTSNLALVLMNALYFKDAWQNEFYKDLTEEGDFKGEKGSTKKEFMHQSEKLMYYKDSKSEMVILPMKSGVYMAVVLGDASDPGKLTSKAESRRVNVTLPKIDLETSLSGGELADFLKKNGVQRAFTDAADFSGMIAYPVMVGDIIQKTRIKLDEEGVEAAAVTAIMAETGMYEEKPPVDFVADRPFSFFIYTQAGDLPAILFEGEIRE